MATSGHSGRKFTLLDAMILVAATAIGLGVIGAHLRPPLPIGLYFRAAAPCLLALSTTLVLLNLRESRPRRRASTRRPGIAACYSAVVGMACGLVISIVFYFRFAVPTMESWAPTIFFSLLAWACNMIPPAVASVWLTMLLGGRWRRESDWLGVAGRLVGIGWIVVFVGQVAFRSG